jgi:hypothetical protein
MARSNKQEAETTFCFHPDHCGRHQQSADCIDAYQTEEQGTALLAAGDTSFPYGNNLGEGLVESVSFTASEKRLAIFNVLENTTKQVFALEQSWICLGIMLSEFKAQEYWRQFKEYPTFDDFISELKHRFNRGRTQLYSYLGVAEALLPTIGAEKLEQMGIAKALELKRAMKKLDGKPLPAGLLEAALDQSKTTTELRGEVGAALHITEDPKGTWFDLQGFFMLPDERKEFKEAFLATEGLLGLSNTLPDHIRRKEVILAWMREWYGTHAAEFNGVQQPANAEPVLIQPIRKDVDGYTSQIPKDVDGPCSCGGNTDCERCK